MIPQHGHYEQYWIGRERDLMKRDRIDDLVTGIGASPLPALSTLIFAALDAAIRPIRSGLRMLRDAVAAGREDRWPAFGASPRSGD